MPYCRSGTPLAGSGRFAVYLSPMSSTKISGPSLAGICTAPEHPASFPQWLAAQFASLGYRRCSTWKGALAVKFLPIASSPVRSKDTCQPHEIGIFRPLDREFDLPREVQLFDASSSATARVIWLIPPLA